jgi:hypothetical protein
MEVEYLFRRADLYFEMSLPMIDGKRHIARTWCGVVAQLVERLVRNEKVAGSNPVGSTIFHG